MNVSTCPICNKPFPTTEIERHAATCLDSQQLSREARLTTQGTYSDDDDVESIGCPPDRFKFVDVDDEEIEIHQGRNSSRSTAAPPSARVDDPAFSLKRRLSEMQQPPTVLDLLSQNVDDDEIIDVGDQSTGNFSCSNGPPQKIAGTLSRHPSSVKNDAQLDWDQLISVTESGIPQLADEQKIRACSQWDQQIKSTQKVVRETMECYGELKLMIEYGGAIKPLIQEMDKLLECVKSRLAALEQPTVFLDAFDTISKRAESHDRDQISAAQARATFFSKLLDDTESQHQKRYQEDLSMVTIRAMDEREQAVNKLGEEYTAQRLTVENELNEMRSKQRTMEEQMARLSSGQFELAEERQAMQTGQIMRVMLTAAQEGFGEMSREHHYRICESQFHRMLTQAGQSQYKVTGVEVIINPVLRKRYQEYQERLKAQGHRVTEYLTFHGTSSAAVDAIVVSGFKIGGVDVPVASGSVHGQGWLYD